ncbi:hypothetical protein [Metabacillus indicus]|uniref:hypothetical protein n=1 Tax=Metabacillus indicus TaxID=246786 RepID=UPI00248FC9BD|nr:hypothetical protein [Metabacillus indicus]
MGFGIEAYEVYHYLQWAIGIAVYILLPAALLFKAGKKREQEPRTFRAQTIIEERTKAQAP